MGVTDNGDDLEMLSPKVVSRERTPEPHTDTTLTTEKESDLACDLVDDEMFTEEMMTFAQVADRDNTVLKELLCPLNASTELAAAEGVRLEFLKNPQAWVSAFTGHQGPFEEDNHYLGYVVGLLECLVNSSPYGEDKHDIYSPLLLIKKFVTVEMLCKRRDPMRTALKLQFHLSEYANIENDKNSIYDRQLEELEKIPKNFALSLMRSCKTPIEVTKLMQLDDDTMFVDVLNSKNQQLVASKMYQKVVWQKFWGNEATSTDKKSKHGVFHKTLYAVKRLLNFLIWNVCYLPLRLFFRFNDKDGGQKHLGQFFSPFSSYLADLLNYFILIALLLLVTNLTVPDPSPVHRLMHQYLTGQLRVEDSPDLRRRDDGVVELKLPTPSVPLAEWMLWLCIFSRIITEWYQASVKKGATARSKLKKYFASYSNWIDIALMVLLLIGICCKLQMYITSVMQGVYREIPQDGSEDRLVLVSQRLILTIYLYSCCSVLALFDLLNASTIHIPGLGPLLRAIKRMFSDIVRVIFLFIFFIAGFIIPMWSLTVCYRAVHRIDGVDDDDDFYSFESFTNTVLTLVWSMFGGLAYNHKENLYNSQDDTTTFFMSVMLVVYAILLGLMCMNLLIAIMCNSYNTVTADKSADWRYAQFEAIMDYNAVTNEGDGMPFIYPFCIPYILFYFVTKPCQKKKAPPEDTVKDNQFAKFLCKYRLLLLEDQSDETGQNGMQQDQDKTVTATAMANLRARGNRKYAA